MNQDHKCIYACNNGITCRWTDCNFCLRKPENTSNESIQGNTTLSNPYDDSNWDGE